jgi:alkylated DNA repair dioxygenase AlkB
MPSGRGRIAEGEGLTGFFVEWRIWRAWMTSYLGFPMNARSSVTAPRAKLDQADLFGARDETPSGFLYQPGFIDLSDEAALAPRLAELPFAPFNFRGHLANRLVTGFGLRYDYASRQVRAAPPIPDWLARLREKVGAFAGQPAESFVQVLINEYPPGAGIGWHKDKPHFDEVVGVSLLSPITFRFRRKVGAAWERRSVIVEPRSAYLLAGASRHLWEHSIPPGDSHRYSITFRTLAEHG